MWIVHKQFNVYFLPPPDGFTYVATIIDTYIELFEAA